MTSAYNPGSRFSRRSPYDWRTNPITGKTEFHAGQDFAAPAGTPIPAATSGTVVYYGLNKGFGNVVIVKNDPGGYSLYGHMQDGDRAALGQRVWQGDTLGRVGSTGMSTGPHLHYSVIRDEAGNMIEHSKKPRDGGSIGVLLDKTNTVDPARYDNYDPTPRYLDETKRAAQIMSGTDASTTSGALPPDRQDWPADRFGRRGYVPAGAASPPASDRPESFDNRFGNWGSVPGSASPVLRELEKYRRSAAPDDLAPTSAQGALAATPASQPYTAGTGGVFGKIWDSLITPAEAALPPAQGAPLLTPYFPGQGPASGDRSGNAPRVPSPDAPLRRVSSAFPGMALPDPDPVPPQQSGRPLGIFTGKPMPSWTPPPPLGGLLNSDAFGNNDGFNFPTGLLFRNPTPPPQTADSIPERRLGRRTYSASPAPAYDPRALAAPLAPSDDANDTGGLLGMLAGKASTDPQSSDQPAPPDDEQEQANLQALEDRLTRTGNINDAWALYNARIARRG